MEQRTSKPSLPLFSRTGGALALGVLLLTSGCGGSGGGGGGPGGSQFILQELSVSTGQVWQLNRAIEFAFSQPVDFATINLNTLSISELGGGPAVGEFRIDPARPHVVIFQPACPIKPDLSDAGFQPGGRQYRVSVPTTSNGSSTVRSVNGSGLAEGTVVVFSTPQTTFPADLFIDTRQGPPTPIPGTVDENGVVRGTRIELLGDNGEIVSIPFIVTNGIGRLPAPGSPPSGPGFVEMEMPLNLYSDIGSRFQVVLEVDQAVGSGADNIDQTRIQFQYDDFGTWTPFATQVTLAANCTATGSTLLLQPLGVLPQNRPMRVLLTPEFEDIVGNRNILPQTDFATMKTGAFTDAAGNFIDFTDELLEEFLLTSANPRSLEDTETVFSTPRADWGGGTLSAAFDFQGTGGPGGNFDWFVPPNTDFVLDTSQSLILGGPDGLPATFQVVINGVVDVRNLYVPASSSIRIQGPNAAFIQCSGWIRVDGRIRVSGNNADSVYTLDTPTQPEVGAAGNCGGGDGGTGSYLTNQVTRRGGNGFGAFNSLGGGGEGGESGWHPDNSTSFGFKRRAAGGGGGTLGTNVVLPNGCFDQTLVGLDAESGMPGETEANSAIRLGFRLPWGGREAPRPFNDINGTDDDFFGVKRKNFGTNDETLVAGELQRIWAGSGGGAGGDATWTDTYPPPTLINNRTDKGAGGGGGAGGLTIYALGDITFGPNGRIEAIGGHGNGGENTNYVNRVGGGSGGGAGGHIILHTASKVDLSRVAPNTVAINAKGGQGGQGNTGGGTPTTGSGGAGNNGETPPGLDSRHVGVTGPNDLGDNPWIPPVPATCSTGPGVIRAVGGDGGPGIIQIHVGDLSGDILYPDAGGTNGTQDDLFGSVKPQPHGYDIVQLKWVDHLLPAFGRFSTAQTKWVSLGGATLLPDSPGSEPIEFLFAGTNPATGEILRTGNQVAELPPLLAPAQPVEAAGLPDVSTTNSRTLLLDASPLTGEDEIFKRNPYLLRRFRLSVGASDFDVQSASYDAQTNVLAVTVSSSGPALPQAGLVELVPRYFAVATGGVADFLPPSAGIRIEFQATRANALGQPDIGNIVPGQASPETGGWASDIQALNIPESADFRFVRLRITFDIQADGGSLTSSTPRPQIDFLRLPFRF